MKYNLGWQGAWGCNEISEEINYRAQEGALEKNGSVTSVIKKDYKENLQLDWEVWLRLILWFDDITALIDGLIQCHGTANAVESCKAFCQQLSGWRTKDFCQLFGKLLLEFLLRIFYLSLLNTFQHKKSMCKSILQQYYFQKVVWCYCVFCLLKESIKFFSTLFWS